MTRQTRFGWALSMALLAGTQVTTLAQDQNTTAQATAGSTTSTPESTMKPGVVTGKDLTISAAKSASHTMLFRALRVSGLTDQASGKGPYTVFAPTNDAFDKLPAGTFDELMKPAAKSRLVKVLAYHVVKGKLKAADLQDGQKLKTLTGGTLTVNKEGETVTIVDGAGNSAIVNQADIEATNGVVHSVDTVLMPVSGK
jgi:uncharacterized surface protein with fasciclin (FAS1) repeats